MPISSTPRLDPDAILRRLIQFDTTNPPGQEAACIQYINELLQNAGFETTIFAKDPQRPNLITRLPGRGDAPPFLLYGHVDVVTTANQEWTYPPFSATVADGFIWGRGTLDMKGAVAMMISALLKAKQDKLTPAGDIILAIVSDEEDGGDYGAKFLVEEHPEQFDGARYALGEFGGTSLVMGGQIFYPIQIAEKQWCSLKATVRGPGGHGSRPLQGGAMARLGRLLTTLDQKRLPPHITPVTRTMLEAMADKLGFPTGTVFRQLLNPALTNRVIDVLGERAAILIPLLFNTVSPTIVNGGEKINVIPSELTLQLDCRLLPGFTPDIVLAELRDLVGPDVEFEVIRFDPGPAEPDLGYFATLASILEEADPAGTAVPMLLPGVTDGRFFSQLGIQTYGFTPVKLPPQFNFAETIHAADERIPVGAIAFGAAAIYQALVRYR